MVERLCTAPSVGPVTAAAFSSTVDDGFKKLAGVISAQLRNAA
jgi:hypothetical protein